MFGVVSIMTKQHVEQIDAVDTGASCNSSLIKFRNPSDGKQYDMYSGNSPDAICKRILNLLDTVNVIPILTVGSVGSGKSTWAQYMVHQLHSARSFHISWFEHNDIKRIDKIIPTLSKDTDHIVVFDNASFALDEMNKEEIDAIAEQLLDIQDNKNGKLVLILNIRPSIYLERLFRSVLFTFHTSMSLVGPERYKNLYGIYSNTRLKRFATHYSKMMLSRGWSFVSPSISDKGLHFETDKPFRIGLVNEINNLHFFLYPKHSCNICRNDKLML